MTVSNIVLKGLEKAVGVLKKENIDWCLFGGLAMQVYKRVRATKDVDLMVTISAKEAPHLIIQMEKHGFRFDRKRGVIRINGFELMRFIYPDEDTNLEIFIDVVTVNTEFQKQILKRKLKAKFFGVEVNIASLDDIILLKTMADRPIDNLDAEYLLQENKDEIDKDYLITWAKKLNIEDKLRKLLQENA